MATLNDITATAWQFSLQGVGFVAEGVADVRQCIDIILRTQKGTDPFRAQFGSDIFDHIDKPPAIAIPNIKKAIVEAIDMWEPRVKIKSVVHSTVMDGARSQLVFYVTYNIVDSDLIDTLQLLADGSVLETDGGTAVKLILEADIPAGSRFFLSMILDGVEALPTPPSVGFASIADLYAWVNDYWGLFGTWYYLQYQNKIVAYINAGIASTGSLTITSPAYMLTAIIPPIAGEQFYYVVFTINGVPVQPLFPQDVALTAENIIVWVTQNWGQYGTWSIVGNELILTSDTALNNATLQVFAQGGSAFTTGFSTGFNS